MPGITQSDNSPVGLTHFPAERYGFGLAIEQVQMSVGGAEVDYDLYDANYTGSSGADVTTTHNVVIQDAEPQSLDYGVVFTSKTPEVATIDAATGEMTYVGNGTARVEVNTP